MTSVSIHSQTIDDAVSDAVSQLKYRGLEKKSRSEIVIEMVNYHSKKFDRQARIVQSALYTALQDQFPKVKILLKEEAITGISAKAILIKGTYKAEGTRTIIELKAIDQMNGRMFAKANASFDSEKEKFENLVAVLSLDAPSLSKSVAKTFSKILRSALNETGVFNLVSSDIIDSADADQIQEQYQCSREECSAIVAEQVNASQVITTQYNKIASGIFYLTASLKDIKTGRTLKEVAIQHDGNIKTLPKELENMAEKLAGRKRRVVRQALAVSGQTGMMVVKSQPTEANIVLDGQPYHEKTDSLLQGIPIGKHKIIVYKGNLGASQTVILVPDKTEQLNLQLKPLKAELQISSTPGASVFLDGNNIGTSPLVVDIRVGKHALEFKKENYSPVTKNVVVKPFVKNRVKAKLFSLPKLQITSVPSGADVFLNFTYHGRTPLVLKRKLGRLTIRLAKSGYEDHMEIIEVRNHVENRVNATLLKIVTLNLSVSPPDASVAVDGEIVGGEERVTYKNYKNFAEMSVELNEGVHTVHVSHREAENTIKFDVNLKSRITKETIQLNMKPSYVDRLEGVILENKRSTWRWKWGSTLAGSVIAAIYAQQQSGLASEAKDKQDQYTTSMMSASSYEAASVFDSQASEQNELIKTHNTNMQTGMVASAALGGIAVWIWLDEPDESDIAFQHLEINPPVILNGQVRLAATYRW